MAWEIEWLESAQEELDREIDYVIREFGYLAAQNAYNRIKNSIYHLACFPRIGLSYPGITFRGFEVRKLHLKHITVFYSPQVDRITILAIWNNAMDSERIPLHLIFSDPGSGPG